MKKAEITIDGKKLAKPKEEFSFESWTDEAVAQSISSKIRTVEHLLEFAKVDLKIWEVERYVINKWDMGSMPRSTRKSEDEKWLRPSTKPTLTGLVQVKVWLKRKEPRAIAIQSLLETLSEMAPVLHIPAIRRVKMKERRALEVCVMDPHVGLLCGYPEADAAWDLDRAAAMIMESMDSLIERAKVFGPFEQVFMPFGNDFVHSDTVFHTTTAGTGQPESISWHHVYDKAERIAIAMVERLREVAKEVRIYQVPGNHSRMADFTIARLLRAYFRHDKGVIIGASSSPYKFHRFGVNLIGYEHGHSVKPIRLAALMANECRKDWAETHYREWHLGDQHRKGSSKPSMLEEQGVSIEYVPGLTAPNEWHRLKSFNHQQRGAMAFVWDFTAGPIGRLQFNISPYSHKAMN